MFFKVFTSLALALENLKAKASAVGVYGKQIFSKDHVYLFIFSNNKARLKFHEKYFGFIVTNCN
jgi:hypothetical protein